MLVRNSWYVAAWASEIGAEKPLGRTILNEPVVMFRSRDGSVAALEGRCAHRRMPLAHGKVIEDRLVCCYHGLQYDASGRCVRVPGQADVPGNIRLRRYPAAERYGAVWLWMGAPDLADESTIFKCELPERDRSACHPFYFHVKANYLYLNDNLSDLLHQAYLHNPSFGGETHSLGETIPEILPFSVTGTCRKPPSFIAFNASIARLSSAMVTGFGVIACPRWVVATWLPLASKRTASRPVKMPHRRSSVSTMRTEPALLSPISRQAC